MAKKFFWGMVFSGLSMVLVQISPVRDQANSLLTSQLKVLSSKVSKGAPVVPDLVLSEQLDENAKEKTTVSASDSEYVIDGQHYVLIKGKYYPASPDNIYEIDGEKIFYVDKRRSMAKKAEQEAQNKEVKARTPAQTIPMTPQQMMEAMLKAQQALAERNEMLEEMK